ncbi:hypothetical protein MVEN_00199700 [Mycena venus]|uniref:Zn(2)-C6 fungal-type domain-containing protein n=1 Tax=Mycena venus TaxID=2733690 RepID=A0A8H6YX73_9AGAR|nr:hypothetical protein MVEN_00199700 [Mycena venus]
MDSLYGDDMDLDSAYMNCLPPWFDPHPHPLDKPPPPPAPAPRLNLTGPATTGSIFYRTPRPEHPRLRTSQACEKCRARKAKCSGDHPSCARCLARGLPCQYAEVGRVRGPNKPKSSRSGSISSSTSADSRYVNVNVKRARRNTTLATIDIGGMSCYPRVRRTWIKVTMRTSSPTAASKRLSLPATLNIDPSLLSPMHGHASGPSYIYGSEYPASASDSASASASSAYTDSRRGSFAFDPALDALPLSPFPPSPLDVHSSPFPHEMKLQPGGHNYDYPALDPLDRRAPFSFEAGVRAWARFQVRRVRVRRRDAGLFALAHVVRSFVSSELIKREGCEAGDLAQHGAWARARARSRGAF